MDNMYKILESIKKVSEDSDYYPGGDYSHEPGSECCGAPIIGYDNGFGQCSSCGEMATAGDDEESLGEGADEKGISQEKLAGRLLDRLQNRKDFSKLIWKHDVTDIADAIEEVASDHAGATDIGSSDMSAMLNQVVRMLQDSVSESSLGEAEVEENAFNQAAAAAARAGKKQFDFDGKTYPVKMDQGTAEKLDDDITEDYDEDEYDQEGEMANSQLRTIEDAARELQSIIDADENLPEWVQKKITLAKDYVDTARDYINANPSVSELDITEGMELGDDVHIKSKNQTGMYYGKKNGKIMVRTPEGTVTVDADDVEKVNTESMKEGKDFASRQLGRAIKKYYGEIYDYGDKGLDYIIQYAPVWSKLFDKHRSDIDAIIVNEPAPVLKQAALELKDIADQVEYELEENQKVKKNKIIEKAVSKSQQQAAGAALAAKKGDIPKSELKGASKEMYKMSEKDLKDFAGTKHKGLPEKKKKTEETTVAGAVATSTDATGSDLYGNPSIYESWNRQLKEKLNEEMNITVTSSSHDDVEPTVNVTATGKDAMALAELLKLSGTASMSQPVDSCSSCGEYHEGECMSEELANQPDKEYRDTEYMTDTLAGGLNRKKGSYAKAEDGDNPMAVREDHEAESFFNLYKEFSQR